ncbi:MAG: YfiR family protein [Pseudomonadota bacterium]
MLHTHRVVFPVFVSCLMLGTLSQSVAQNTPTEESLEYSVKAAYLFKFGSFVEWPPNTFLEPTSPLMVGVVGEDPFGIKLEQIIQGHTINGRPLVIRRFNHGQQPQDVHILFISKSEQQNLNAMIAGLNGVLTIGEFEPSLPGVMINFTLNNNKVRFDVDLDAVNRAELKISSKLLSVARNVRGKVQ